MKQPEILLVDDDSTVALLGKMVLSQARFSVNLASSVAEFWKAVENFSPDIILLDFELPDGDGVKLCQKLRSLSRFAQTPVLIITGHDDHESVVEALASGATDFMSKPLNWQLLAQRVRYMWKSHLILLAAQQSQRLLARAQAIAKTGNWEKDLHSGSIIASEQFLQMLEHGECESGDLFELFFSVVVEEDQSLISEKIEETLQTKKTQTVEHRMITNDGLIFVRHFLEIHFDPVTGEPLSLCGTLQDITEEKRREMFTTDRNSLLELGIKQADNKELYKAFSTLLDHQIANAKLFYLWKEKGRWRLEYASENVSPEFAAGMENYFQTEPRFQDLQKEANVFLVAPMPAFVGAEESKNSVLLLLPVAFEKKGEANRLGAMIVKKNHPMLREQEKINNFFINVSGLIRILANHIALFSRLEYQAYHDVLTGLPNREFFFETMEEALAEREGPCALLLIDIDRFKNINDSLGHNVGDRILCEMAARLRQLLLPGDVLARLSGDEFAWLTDTTTQEEIQNRVQQILTNLGQPFKEENYQVNLSARCGITLFPEHGTDAAQLQKYADIAMYHAKKNGGNCCVYYDPDKMESFTQKLVIENEMKQGLERGEFYLLFQPQVESSNREVTAYESLLRWKRPDGVFISPEVFIAVAEETGIIVPLGTWVLEQSCKSILELHKRGNADIRISVNVSTVQFVQDNFVDVVNEVLQKTGFPADKLELEVTESAVMQDITLVAARLEELRKLGLTIAIDDFGTGYSSMSYLKFLPIDCLKIDRSFIMELDSKDEKKSEALVDSMITLAENLGLEVVAEGVETEGQLEFLKQRKCRYIQGYLTGKPGPLPV